MKRSKLEYQKYFRDSRIKHVYQKYVRDKTRVPGNNSRIKPMHPGYFQGRKSKPEFDSRIFDYRIERKKNIGF